MSEPLRRSRPPLATVAVLLAASVLLSRIVGYLREVVLANQVGAGVETDAYYAAFQIPDLLNYLLAGGALSIAFLPLYTRVLESRGEEAARRLFATVLGTLTAITVAATLPLWIYSDELIAFQFPEFSESTRALTARLTRIVLPAQIFFVSGGILRAVLMAHGRFASHAMAPLLYNGAIIAGGISTGTPEGFAWGALVGALLGPWLVPLVDLWRDRRPEFRFAPFDADFRRYLWIAAPLMFGLSLATVDEWYERWFGALLGAGVVAQLGFARRLMQVPVAVVGQAVAAAALPTLSRLWSSGRHDELDQTLLRTLQASLAVAILAGGAFWVFAQPLVEIVYHHGRFTAHSAERVSAILAILSLAVPAWVAQQVGVRAFFAREDTWRPMLLGTGVALAAIPIYLAFGRRFGAEGLAAAGALSMTVNAALTLGWSRRRYGSPALAPLADTLGRALLITGVACVVGSFAQLGGAGRGGALLDLLLAGSCFAMTALFGCWWIGDSVIQGSIAALWGRVRSFGRRGSSDG